MVRLIITLVAFLGLQLQGAQCAAIDDSYIIEEAHKKPKLQLEKLETISISPISVKPIQAEKYNKLICNLNKPIVRKRKLKNWNLC